MKNSFGRKWISLTVFMAAAGTAFFINCANPSQLSSTIESMEYIQVSTTGEIIRLEAVREIEPTIWKGSCDGVLFYKNGDSVDIQISNYGKFFAIKDSEFGLFSDGVLYEYTIE